MLYMLYVLSLVSLLSVVLLLPSLTTLPVFIALLALVIMLAYHTAPPAGVAVGVCRALCAYIALYVLSLSVYNVVAAAGGALYM